MRRSLVAQIFVRQVFHLASKVCQHHNGGVVRLKKTWLAARFGQFAPLVVEICSVASLRLIMIGASTATFLAA